METALKAAGGGLQRPPEAAFYHCFVLLGEGEPFRGRATRGRGKASNLGEEEEEEKEEEEEEEENPYFGWVGGRPCA